MGGSNNQRLKIPGFLSSKPEGGADEMEIDQQLQGTEFSALSKTNQLERMQMLYIFPVFGRKKHEKTHVLKRTLPL